MAIRVGWQEDGAWNKSSLGDFDLILCASPVYLERRGTPETPADLAGHEGLALRREAADASPDYPDRIELTVSDGSGALEKAALPLRITTTNQIALQQMCEQAMGLACLFLADARPALERGTLTRVLPRWRLPSRPVTLVTPRRPSEPAKVRVATAAIERYFAALVDTR